MQSPSDKYDVIVVGAGPAGLCASQAAAAGGVSVLLLEKERQIGHPVRTSGGTWIEDMAKSGIPSTCYNPIKRAYFNSPKNSAVFDYDEPLACVLDVRRAYQHLALQSAKHGCEIVLGAGVQGLLKKNGVTGGVIYTQQGKTKQVEAKVVIDATGLSAVLARDAGLLTTWERIGVGAEYEAYVENLNKDTSHLIVGNEVVPSGYAWVFPVDDSRARIGVGVIRPEVSESPFECLSRLLKTHSVLRQMGRIVPIELHQWNVPCAGPIKEFTKDRLVVVGDAAGHASPLVGEGIRHAMKFGQSAGRIAALAAKEDIKSPKDLGEFQQEVKKEISTSYRISLKVQQRIAAFSDEKWDEAVGKLKQLEPEEFARLMRGDFALSSLLSLLTKHPFLATSTSLRIAMSISKGH
jgi:digeranylgeranylglycerophospholipid reductase